MQIQSVSGKKYAPATIEQKEDAKKRIKQMQKDGEKLRKGMFEFVDAQGGWLDFDYRFYPGEPVVRIKITHGEICELPMDVIKHLNNVYKKVRLPAPERDEGGRPVKEGSVMKVSRCRFTPMDVM